ncbi:MAG: DUF1552 domain-containing protein [Polyangiaceae bacterium]
MPKPLSRRALLHTAALGALCLPFLRARSGHAEGAAPKRFLWLSTPMGTIKESFWPESSQSFDDLFDPGLILAPDEGAGFAALKEKLLVLRGIDVRSALKPDVPKDHQPDYLNMLIGRQPSDPSSAKPAGISMDQVIAAAVGQDTPFASIALGTSTSYNTWNSPVATGANQPVAPLQDPREAFELLFSGDVGPPEEAEQRKAERLRVLAAVSGELGALEKRLGCDDKSRLGTHVAAVEELEKQLELGGGACEAPEQPDKASYEDGTKYPAAVKAHMDLAVAALACGRTRVLTLQLGRRLMPHPFLGIGVEHHVLAHYNAAGKSTAQQRQMQADIEHWYAQQFYYLVRKLDGIPDVDGKSLLDNTVVVWAHEQADGKSHSRKDHVYVVAGSCGGAIPTGHRKDFRNGDGDGPAHSGLLITLANAMGVDIEEFGDPELSNGPLGLA